LQQQHQQQQQSNKEAKHKADEQAKHSIYSCKLSTYKFPPSSILLPKGNFVASSENW